MMQLLNKRMTQNEKKRIAYYSALALFFSYLEFFLPRIVPFLRLGLSNTAVLLALELPLHSFFLIAIIKSVASCLISGTLFSPFFIVSLCQSLSSAVFMFLLNRLNAAINLRFSKKMMSVYGISCAGSFLSAVVQILLCRLYLGKGVFLLLGPMILFSLVSGIFTALLCEWLLTGSGKRFGKISRVIKSFSFELPSKNLAEGVEMHEKSEIKADIAQEFESKLIENSPVVLDFKNIVLLFVILICTSVVFTVRNIYIPACIFILALVFQKILIFRTKSSRKVKILPYIWIILFVMISCLFVPSGKVLVRFAGFSITKGAVFIGIEKSLKLCAAGALSQCAFFIKPPEDSILGYVFAYYKEWTRKSNWK